MLQSYPLPSTPSMGGFPPNYYYLFSMGSSSWVLHSLRTMISWSWHEHMHIKPTISRPIKITTNSTLHIYPQPIHRDRANQLWPSILWFQQTMLITIEGLMRVSLTTTNPSFSEIQNQETPHLAALGAASCCNHTCQIHCHWVLWSLPWVKPREEDGSN